MSAATRPLAVCADDFGMAPEVSAAVADLARRRRLSAVSCLVGGPHWRGAAALLRELPATVERGLHLNLSDGAPLAPALAAHWPRYPALSRLIVLAHLGRLPRDALRAEFRAQLDAFIEASGAPPRFVDGHQHVHHLPGVRELVLELVEAIHPAPAVRSTARLLGPGEAFKRVVIERTGGRDLERALRQRGVAHNAALVGAYGFRDPDYGALFRRWLAGVPAAGALLFCHPGRATPGDPIAAAREREFAYLGSDAFPRDLAAAGVVLGPVWRTA